MNFDKYNESVPLRLNHFNVNSVYLKTYGEIEDVTTGQSKKISFDIF